MGRSTDGRDIPLIVMRKPLPASPASLKSDKRVVVYIQANIHAGEVEGKEAALMFARDLLADDKDKVLSNVVFLICPNFNPDGNEKIDKANRTHQNGPSNGVGIRYNGQNLDLNRDAIKAESPELRAVLSNVFNRWDPQVFIDCHTTNGSYHVEPVTFNWMVNPNGDTSLIGYMRDKMSPAISRQLRDRFEVENCFYGEFYDMAKPSKGWVMEASEPRYMVNYAGLRNRLAILNENYVYSDYKSRVYGCYYLLRSLALYSSEHHEEIRYLVEAADKRTIARGLAPSPADSFAYTLSVRPLKTAVKIRTWEADVKTDERGRRSFTKSDRQVDVTVPYFIDYYPAKSTRLPYAYLLTVNDPQVIDLLKAHGIVAERLASDYTLKVQSFRISELKAAPRLNQGHYLNSVKGSFEDLEKKFPAGTVLVKSAQVLSPLVSCLLEPESGDGLLAWNFFDRYLAPQWGAGFNAYPVYKLMTPLQLDAKTME